MNSPASKYLSPEATDAIASQVLGLLLAQHLTPDQAVAVLAIAWRRIRQSDLDAGRGAH